MHLHSYKVINENKEGRLEVCVECKKKLSIKKDSKTGRIDNKKYLEEHQRDTAQPYGKTGNVFKKYYGEAPKDLRFK